MNEELDFVNLHTIFMYNKDHVARLGAQLYCEKGEEDESYCVDKSVKMWIAKGLCPQKIVMGTEIYDSQTHWDPLSHRIFN